MVLILGGALALLAFSGCSPKRDQQLSTGAVLSRTELPLGGFKGDLTYSVINPSALPRLYEDFRSVLFKQGLVKWDSRFDCNHFSSLYISLSQATYAVDNWLSTSPAQTLALAEVWYRPAGGPNGHAIVAAVTPSGLIFIEPQTGQQVTLTSTERSSIYLVKW